MSETKFQAKFSAKSAKMKWHVGDFYQEDNSSTADCEWKL